MLKNVPNIVLTFTLISFLLNCAHSSVKQNILIFKNSENGKKVVYLKEKIVLNPKDVESRMELGNLFLSEGMIEESIAEYEGVLNIDTNNIQAYLLLSLSLQKRRNPDLPKVVMLLEKASKIAPENADVRLNLAQVYDKLKDEDKATNEFNKAIELFSDQAVLVSAHLGLMVIYKRRGDLEKANEEYKAAYEIFPGIGDMIKQEEINRMTHIEFSDQVYVNDGLHPPIEKRIKRVQKEIRKLSESAK